MSHHAPPDHCPKPGRALTRSPCTDPARSNPTGVARTNDDRIGSPIEETEEIHDDGDPASMDDGADPWLVGCRSDRRATGADRGARPRPCPAITTDGLNPREESSLEADVLLVIPVGADVITGWPLGRQGAITDGPVEADGFTWYEVSSEGYGPDGATPGWVAGELLAPAE